MYIEIETAYASAHDISFIMEFAYDDNGEPISTECKGWYYGEPNEENTKTFYGKIFANYEW